MLYKMTLAAAASAALLMSCTSTNLTDASGGAISTETYFAETLTPVVRFCTAHQATGSTNTQILTAAGFVQDDSDPKLSKVIAASDGTEGTTFVSFDGQCDVVINGIALRVSQLAPAFRMAMEAQGYAFEPGGRPNGLAFSNGTTTLNTSLAEFTRTTPTSFLLTFRRY